MLTKRPPLPDVIFFFFLISLSFVAFTGEAAASEFETRLEEAGRKITVGKWRQTTGILPSLDAQVLECQHYFQSAQQAVVKFICVSGPLKEHNSPKAQSVSAAAYAAQQRIVTQAIETLETKCQDMVRMQQEYCPRLGHQLTDFISELQVIERRKGIQKGKAYCIPSPESVHVSIGEAWPGDNEAIYLPEKMLLSTQASLEAISSLLATKETQPGTHERLREIQTHVGNIDKFFQVPSAVETGYTPLFSLTPSPRLVVGETFSQPSSPTPSPRLTAVSRVKRSLVPLDVSVSGDTPPPSPILAEARA